MLKVHVILDAIWVVFFFSYIFCFFFSFESPDVIYDFSESFMRKDKWIIKVVVTSRKVFMSYVLLLDFLGEN